MRGRRGKCTHRLPSGTVKDWFEGLEDWHLIIKHPLIIKIKHLFYSKFSRLGGQLTSCMKVPKTKLSPICVANAPENPIFKIQYFYIKVPDFRNHPMGVWDVIGKLGWR